MHGHSRPNDIGCTPWRLAVGGLLLILIGRGIEALDIPRNGKNGHPANEDVHQMDRRNLHPCSE